MKFILTADLHLRLDRPRCRIDEDWFGTQKKVVNFILSEAGNRDCNINIVGDIFHTSVVQEQLKNWLLETFIKYERGKTNIHIMAGNHDLPYHSWDNLERSSFGILSKFFKPIIGLDIQAAPFNMDTSDKWANPDAKIIFTHQLVFENEKARPFKGVGKTAHLDVPRAVGRWIDIIEEPAV